MNNSTSPTVSGNTASPDFLYSKDGSWLVVLTMNLISLPALVLSILIYVAVYKNKSLQTPGYFLLVSENASEGLCLFSMTVMTKTLLLVRYVLSPPRWYLDLCFHTLHIGYYSTIFHLNVVAVNRFCAVVLFQNYKTMFTRKLTVVFIIIGWLFGVAVDVIMYVSGVEGSHDPHSITINYGINISAILNYLKFYLVSTVFTCCFSVLLYIVVIMKLYKGNSVAPNDGNAHGVSKDVARLSFQFMIIIFFFILAYGFFNILNSYVGFGNPYLVYTAEMLYIVSYSANAYIHLAMNKTLRGKVLKLIFEKHTDEGPTAGSFAGTNFNKTPGPTAAGVGSIPANQKVSQMSTVATRMTSAL